MYWRAYAWRKLVTIWCLTRGEGSNWLEASSLTYSSSTGLKGRLTRTKTTGPGKNVKTREINVSSEAYICAKDWLRTGYELWQAAPLPRENFIALPSRDLQGFRGVGAETRDRVVLTRQLPAIVMALKLWSQVYCRTGIATALRLCTVDISSNVA